MFRCRLIRIVVNASLIVVMMIQSGMAHGFAGDCRAKRESSSFMCEGCGCCEVSAPTERCSCCSGEAEHDGGGSCCMGSSDSSEDEMMASDEWESGETLRLQVIVISTTDSTVTDNPRDQQHDAITSTCRCGVESQPIGDSSPLRPTVERRDSVAVRFADLAAIFGDTVPKAPRIFPGEFTGSPPHFSQIHLCIWRL